jgi:cellulose synthase/poly-beta-1,6-N-acetylglucosamine synthase-like glycosyltransferase
VSHPSPSQRLALSRAQRAAVIGVGLLWAVATAVLVRWWLVPDHRGVAWAFWLNSAALAFEFVVLPAWFLAFLPRMRRPSGDGPLPDLRVAMVVTKAPSEPWPVVRRTLAAMLDQRFERPYDVWLADESPDDDVSAWCREHGVAISTRRGMPGYHQEQWPRRRRCKEGNLAFFYDVFGYRLYDVVAQLDADHVPEPDYLRHVVLPFADPGVGWVAAPSICDRNAARSWSARGRLYVEAPMHGAAQASSTGSGVPCCIGSHYAVRTAALAEAGGLGPELAEDFSTTLALASHGWRGVFAIDAIAHGDGPATLEDCITQDLQWSRSMMTVLLTVAPRQWPRLRPRAKAKLGFCLLWYPLVAATMTIGHLLAPLAVLLGAPPAHVPIGGFAARILTPIALMLVLLWLLRRWRLLRPVDSPVLSWEAVVFLLIRWPWTVIGCVQAVLNRIRRRELTWKVTPKGVDAARPLSLTAIAPSLVITTGSLAAVLATRGSSGDTSGYVLLSLLQAGVYLAVAVTAVALHLRENPRPRFTRLRGLVTAPNLSVSGALCALVATMGVSSTAVSEVFAGRGDVPQPYPVAAKAFVTLALGVTTDPLARTWARPFTTTDLESVNAFEQSAQHHADIVMSFADWRTERPDLTMLQDIADRGSIPEITWEPWAASSGRADQPAFALARIANGAFDGLVWQWARDLAWHHGPVRLRFAQEMNTTTYPWSERRSGNAPGDYVRAWRHVHDIFAQAGATNVRWVWSPLASTLQPATVRAMYPGDPYVDVVGLSGFNGGTETGWSTGWRTFRAIFGPALGVVRRAAPAKPVEISEVGSAEGGGDKARWIHDAFAFARANPRIEALLWFDLDKEADWRIDSSQRAGRAFRAAAADGSPVQPMPPG